MIFSVAQIASSAVILALAGSCGRNMLQTANLFNKSTSTGTTLLPSHAYSTPENTVEHLQSLKRRELLEVFSSSRVCSNLKDVEGEWNGILLENNGMIMTGVSRIMTHGLFGKGRIWNGKAFGPGGVGRNRFFGRNDKSMTEFEHAFDFSVDSSQVQPDAESILVLYSKYQHPVSLWKTMVDEVRLLPGSDDVMIGLGSMAWSGGGLNGAPFCLWRVSK